MSCHPGDAPDPAYKHGVSVYNGCSGCEAEGLYDYDPVERIHRMLARAEKAEKRVAKLEAALRNCRHAAGCLAGFDGEIGRRHPCTCGRDAALEP